MSKLLRVVHSSDRKARPSVTVTVLGESDDRAKLIQFHHEDIARIQVGDYTADQEAENDEADAEGRPARTISPIWKNDTRWEMDVQEGELRQLVYVEGDGDSGSITYHIID